MRSLGALVVAFVATLALPGVARAESAIPVHVDYEAHAGCPDQATFTRALAERVPIAEGERGPKLGVRFRTGPRGFDGVLVVNGAERVVHGKSCDEVVSALAVIASVVVQNEAPTAVADAKTAPTEAPSSPPAAAPAAPDTPWVDIAEQPPDPRPPVKSLWTVSLGMGLGAASGASPTVLASVDVFGEVSRSFGGVLEPAARLRLQRTTEGGSDRLGGGARFALTTAGSDLCPVALRTSALRAQACVRGEAGELEARGDGVEPVRSETRPWFAVGPVARLRLDVGGPFFAEIEGGLLGLFVRDRFFVEPSTLVYRPPVLAVNGSFGLGVAFR